MIFKFMNKKSNDFSIEKMAKTFGVSFSGYYKFINRKESKTAVKNKELLDKIKLVHKKSRGIYGSPRIHFALEKQGEKCSRKRIAKLMKQNNIQSKIRKKWKATLKANNALHVAPNLLNQNFKVDSANKFWVQDITYIHTNEGWLYVSAVLDLYSRKIIGLGMSEKIDTDLVIKSLNQAVIHRKKPANLILHSDRGTQYTSSEYKKFAEENKFNLSMSAKGNCYDNAPMESFFHTLKTEHVFFNKYKTKSEAMISIFEYIEVFYNRERYHSSLGYMSPVEFEKMAVVG